MPLIVPVVFYQGTEPWRFPRQFAELVADEESDRGWVTQFEHLPDRAAPGVGGGTLGAWLAQLALMIESTVARPGGVIQTIGVPE